MPTHQIHREKETFYFITFTCYKWLNLIERTGIYDYFEEWVIQLAKRKVRVCGYVFMPNHIHLLVYIEAESEGLNKVIGDAKRFMAYEIVKRLKGNNEKEILRTLSRGVRERERLNGKLHQVFRLSFDAKEVKGEREINHVLDYIHQNPVNGKWSLVDEYSDYPYSSVKYYECELKGEIPLFDYREVGLRTGS